METIKKSNSQKNLFLIETNRKPTKGDLLLRHIWKNNPKLECKSWWRYKDTVTIDYLEQYTTLNGSFRDAVSAFKVQNIYITSDEEIKEGDWWFYICPINGVDYGDNGNPIVKNNLPNSWFEKLHDKSNYKKIILTTDQDLIKDGVQAINDEFLEWFVKNPSCDFAHLGFTSIIGDSETKRTYKIIIPKEEPKQEINIDDVGISSTQIFTLKQETLEEVALKYFPNKMEEYDIFLMGAKWKQQQINNILDEYITLLKSTTEFEVLDSFRTKVEKLENLKR